MKAIAKQVRRGIGRDIMLNFHSIIIDIVSCAVLDELCETANRIFVAELQNIYIMIYPFMFSALFNRQMVRSMRTTSGNALGLKSNLIIFLIFILTVMPIYLSYELSNSISIELSATVFFIACLISSWILIFFSKRLLKIAIPLKCSITRPYVMPNYMFRYIFISFVFVFGMMGILIYMFSFTGNISERVVMSVFYNAIFWTCPILLALFVVHTHNNINYVD